MGNILRDISLVWLLAHCLIMFLLLFESRKSRKETTFFSSVFFAIFGVINMLNIYILGRHIAVVLLPVTCVLPSLILFLWLARNRDSRFLFTFCFVDTIVLWVMVLTKFLDVIFAVDGYIVLFIGRIVLILLIEFLIYKYVRKTYQELQSKITKGWGLFAFTGMIFYTGLLFYAFVPSLISVDYTKSFPLIFILIMLPIMYATIYILIKNQIETAEIKEKNSMLGLQVQMAQERISNNLLLEETTKILRHDIKHHMVLLYDYINKGEITRAKEYINTFNETVEQNAPKRFCHNNTLNVVMCYYDRIAAEKNIKFDANIKLSDELEIDEQDLVVLFSNAIENAVNHLTSAKAEDKNARISVNAFADGRTVLIEVKNPCSESVQFEGGIPVANKKKPNHGLGTKSMIYLVKKYDGIYSFTLENNEFIFRCGL